MADCGALLSAHVAAQGRANYAESEVSRLDEESDMLVDLLVSVDDSIGDQEAFIAEVTEQIEKAIADRIAEIDAVDARIAELLALLAGGPDEAPPDANEQAALEAELLELTDLADRLAPERAALAAGNADLSPTSVKDAVQGYSEAKADATGLLGQMRTDKETFENRVVDNGIQAETETGNQASAAADAQRIVDLARGAGCDWVPALPDGPTPEDPEDPEDPEEPEEPDEPGEPDEPEEPEEPVDDEDSGDDEEEEPVSE